MHFGNISENRRGELPPTQVREKITVTVKTQDLR